MKMKNFMIASCVAVLVGVGGLFWLLSNHRQSDAYNVAVEFLRLLKTGAFDKAYELTTKAGLVGADAAAFQKKVAGECLEDRGVSYTFPPQTNGNRLRRWIYGRDVEMPEVGVEFEDPLCPVRITLRRDQNKKWKVYFFESHAQ